MELGMPDRLTDWAGWLRQKINYYTTTLMALGLIIRAQIHVLMSLE